LNNIFENFALFLFFYLFQSLIYVYSIYLFSNHPVELKPFLICSFLSMLATYIARSMLTYGVHTLFSLIALILLAVGFLKIPAQRVVKSTLIIAILTFFFELIVSLVCVTIIGNDRYKEFLQTNHGKTVIGILINLLLSLSVLPFYFIKKIKARQQGEFYNGKNSQETGFSDN